MKPFILLAIVFGLLSCQRKQTVPVPKQRDANFTRLDGFDTSANKEWLREKHVLLNQLGIKNLENGADSLAMRFWHFHTMGKWWQLLEIAYEDEEWEAHFYKIYVNEKTDEYDHHTVETVKPHSEWDLLLENINKFQLGKITGGGESGTDGESYEVEIADNRTYKVCGFLNPYVVRNDWQGVSLIAVFTILEIEFGVKFEP